MKVAVIGGGFSGLIAGYLLEKEGIDVTIYEKEELVGGHCKTITFKNVNIDIGTVCAFTEGIKELLVQLQVDYNERFIYRSFVDENYHRVEHMLREDVVLLMEELSILNNILKQYSPYLENIDYGYIPKALNIPLKTFLKDNGLRFIEQVLSPYLSSFGFGSIDEVQAYYIFKVFNLKTIYSFITGKKSLFIKNGSKELITKLSQNISNIRYSIDVTNIETVNDKVKVETLFDIKYYDKVLIASKIPTGVIKDIMYNEFMQKVNTNPFILCAYEVSSNDLATTYYKNHLGKKNKLQFFYITKQNNRTILLGYSYGQISKELINDISTDIEKLGITIKQLLTVHQWDIFPHFKAGDLTEDFYEKFNIAKNNSNILLIGSLVAKPSIDSLYISIKEVVKNIIKNS